MRCDRSIALCGEVADLDLLPRLVEGILRASSNAGSLLFFLASRKFALEAIVFSTFLRTCNRVKIVPGGKIIAVIVAVA